MRGAVLLLAAVAAACQTQPARKPQGAYSMLRESILKKDPAAALEARQAGPAANPEIIPLTHDQDAKVRRIALYCLNETGGPDAALAMVAALADEDPQVRGAALKGLHSHPDRAAYKPLLHAFAASAERYVRQQAPLILGKMPGANAADLRKACEGEADPEAREGCTTALAKLGDLMAREEFLAGLEASQGRVRARYLEYAEYIRQPWLLKPLGGLLDDTSPMVRVGVDARPDLIEYLRACDLAVNLIAEIGGARFSFAVNRMTNYSHAQLDEVKKYVAALPQ